ncbi:DUF6946 family protein [Sutcliffiella cohnii]
MELARSWEGANNLPSCVETVFVNSGIPLFQNVKVLYGFPEYKVSLPGGSASSQNDLYLLARSGEELITIMVEGKVAEPFGETVTTWKGSNPSKGKRVRLDALLSLLDLKEDDVYDKRYQLLHRTASALLEAEKVGSKNAMMLVHSFSKEGKWYEDYEEYVELFNLVPKKNAVVGPATVNGVNLYFGWVVGKPIKPKEYFYNIFKTEKARKLADEIDYYLYNESPYKDEVEDYHERYKKGVRTDCIGYVSKRDSNKFVTLTEARKGCFVLHLGKKLHTETAKTMQSEIDELLGRKYEETDRGRLTPGEVYIRLEWVDSLNQIKGFIDQAYGMRLEK